MGVLTLEFYETEPKAKGLYFAEKNQIKSEIGNLEEIREQLGLSQRKICQMLLVDPSSWTKWIKPGQDAPAYIYRSLQWCLAILEKYPETHPLALQLMREKSGKIDEISQKLESKLQLHKSILFDLNLKVENVEKDRKEVLKQNKHLKIYMFVLSLVTLALLLKMFFN